MDEQQAQEIRKKIYEYFQANPTVEVGANKLARNIDISAPLVMYVLRDLPSSIEKFQIEGREKYRLKRAFRTQLVVPNISNTYSRPNLTPRNATPQVIAHVNQRQQANRSQLPIVRQTNNQGISIPKLVQNLSRPRYNTPEYLFEYVVHFAIQNKKIRDTKQHNQWAGIFFHYEKTDHQRQSWMSQVKHEYSIYFTGGLKYSFEIAKIIADFPHWFGRGVVKNNPIEQLYADIDHALNIELREAQDKKNKESYAVDSLLFMQRLENGNYVYSANIKTKEGEEPHLREGLAFTLTIAGNNYRDCEVVDFDYENSELIFTYHARLNFTDYSYKKITIDNSFLVSKLKTRLLELAQQAINPQYPIAKFVNGKTTHLAYIPHSDVPDYISERLDESQNKAFNAALNHDITFIWGPPGTGKSYTLASIIRAFYEIKGERTAVCCVSNVAVDQLVNKVVDTIEKDGLQIEPGNFYRAGHSTDERILSTNFLFPNNDYTNNLRSEIKGLKDDLNQLIKQSGHREKVIELKAMIKDLHNLLREKTDYLVNSSKVIFSTISNFVGSDRIHQSQFDNLIVDEASMLAMPQLLAIANKVTKRIILVGDFQQLSPIALAPSKLLRDNVFALCGISIHDTDHPALHQLLNQRRSNENIVSIFNRTFYRDKLRAEKRKLDDIVNIGPLSGRPISNIQVNDGAFRFTKGGTRQNPRNAEYVMSLLDKYERIGDYSFTIGVITPYKGQVSLLRALKNERNYPEEFAKNIKFGTVHTFQGSECDVIIFDIVDTDRTIGGGAPNIGQLYGGAEGEQLMNVAVSRARHKLIVVGNARYFLNATGYSLSDKTRAIFTNLTKFTTSYTL